jgi:hypothetical protein
VLVKRYGGLQSNIICYRLVFYMTMLYSAQEYSALKLETLVQAFRLQALVNNEKAMASLRSIPVSCTDTLLVRVHRCPLNHTLKNAPVYLLQGWQHQYVDAIAYSFVSNEYTWCVLCVYFLRNSRTSLFA